MKRIIVFAGMLLFTASRPLMAQDTTIASLPDKWSLQQCIDYARQHNISLNTLRLSAQSGQQVIARNRVIARPRFPL